MTLDQLLQALKRKEIKGFTNYTPDALEVVLTMINGRTVRVESIEIPNDPKGEYILTTNDQISEEELESWPNTRKAVAALEYELFKK